MELSPGDFHEKLNSEKMKHIGGVSLTHGLTREQKDTFFNTFQNFKLKLDYSLELDEVMPILEAIGKEEIKVKDLWMVNDTKQIPPATMSLVIPKVEVVRCYYMIKDQAEAVFKAIVNSKDLKLRVFDASGSKLSSVPPLYLQLALTRLEEVDLSNTGLTEEQQNQLIGEEFKTMKLKRLYLEGCRNLAEMPSSVLSHLVVALEEFKFGANYLDENQITSILMATVIKDQKTRMIDLEGNCLRFVSQDILKLSMLKIDDVNLRNTGLTATQVKDIFVAIIQCDSLRLKKLDFSNNDFSLVSPEMISQAREKLEELNVENDAWWKPRHINWEPV